MTARVWLERYFPHFPKAEARGTTAHGYWFAAFPAGCTLPTPRKRMNPLEQRIKYKFRNSLFLAEALTHPSLGHETQRHHFDNQRLEFLGDAVLQLIFTEYLFDQFPKLSEG